MKIHFRIPYYTRWGQNIFVSGNIPELGNNDIHQAFPLKFEGHEDWTGEITCNTAENQQIDYHYLLFDENDGSVTEEWSNDRTIQVDYQGKSEIFCVDNWNSPSSIENVFMTSPFQKVFFKRDSLSASKKKSKNFTHQFIVKAPLLKQNQQLCIIGNCPR
jgi:4-alpha-glucanotransferase